MKSSLFSLFLAWGALLSASGQTVVFEKDFGNGHRTKLYSETIRKSNASTGEKSELRYELMLFDTPNSSKGRSVWKHDDQRYGTNAVRSGGFYFFDLSSETTDGKRYVCYKSNGRTMVEELAAASSNSVAQEIHNDVYGTKWVTTAASFSATNSPLSLLLGFNNNLVGYWQRKNLKWERDEQKEIQIPLWARPINMSSRGINIQEYFPVDEFTNASWGIQTNGVQLGLRFQKSKYQENEMIIALLSFRNKADHPLRVQLTPIPFHGGPIDCFLKTSDGIELQQQTSEIAPLIFPLTKTVGVNTQLLHGVHLEKNFSLSPGAYDVWFRARVFPGSAADSFSLESGKTRIVVEPENITKRDEN